MRKIIEFDDQTFGALKLLASDRMSTLQELADEAFGDLLKKHGRPVGLKDALRQSLRRIPANDPRPKDLRTKAGNGGSKAKSRRKR